MSLPKDIRKYIIVPTLQAIEMWSPSSEILVYGTGFVETNYDYLVQIGNPANGGNGFFQDEDSDYADICQYLINGFNKGLLGKILSICMYPSLPKAPETLIWDIKLAVIFCRLHYWRIKKPLPKENDAVGMAQYHKVYYNSALGDADVNKNTEIFKGVINGEL